MGAARPLRRRLSRVAVPVAARVLPPLLSGYLALVWRSSRVEDTGLERVHELCAEHGGAVALVWHEEVLGASRAYPSLGFQPCTLASRSRAGEIATRVLERAGFRVFRGGSSSGSSRRRAGVLREMIDHTRKRDGVLWGITVDGSRGPARRVKRGALVLARECQQPIVLVHTAYARSLRLPTWDRTVLPLPFGRIRHAMRGPYAVPDDAATREGMERFRQRLERDLEALAAEGRAAFGGTR